MAPKFQHPFQCLQYLRKSKADSCGLLIASAGPKIYSCRASLGYRVAVWPSDSKGNGDTALVAERQGPPEKKRKFSPSTEDEDKNIAKTAVTWSNVPLLVASPDEQYIIALTAEDKCIRVFMVEDDGCLRQLSARPMPKRPCALTVIADGSTILVGDKFGDVYSLPLLLDEDQKEESANAPRPKTFQPSATTLTVHTKRNLAALEQQLRQSGTTAPEEKQCCPSYECEILLGHVSMLTDLAFVSLPSPNGTRHYLLTADRDEHIRVSRGPPQAYVIENYCLGHTSFITKLCVPDWAPNILISGGGDNHLIVWDWLQSRIIQNVSLSSHQPEDSEITVRGIWATSLCTSTDDSSKTPVVLVAMEGSPNLLCYVLEPMGTMKFQSLISLSGNVLALTIMEPEGEILVSVDGVREIGSAHAWRTGSSSPQVLLECWKLKSGEDNLEWVDDHNLLTTTINVQGTEEVLATEHRQRKELDNVLYGLGNLRKRNSAGDRDDE